jgi:TolA-binding protein
MKNAGESIDVASSLPQPLVELIREHHGHLPPSRRASAEQRWLAQIHGRRSRRPRLVWAAVALAANVAIVAILVVTIRRATPPLEVAVTGGHLVSDGAIETDTGKAPRLHFSDGSDIQLSATTHASLRHVDGYGATVSLRDGEADVDITHRTGARWAFEAGPFVIRVTGTAFRFVWKPETEEFELLMQRGTVEVQGPLTDGALALHAGQHLFVRVRSGESVIRARESENASGGAGSTEPTAGTAARTSPGVAGDSQSIAHDIPGDSDRALATPSGHRENVGETWPALVASGDYDAVMADVRRRGLDTALDRASATGLAALADASRYRRDDNTARLTLLTERRRFPGLALAREAAFLLGRLDETQNNSTAAVEWYRKYAGEDPDGRYVSEALGRTMILLATASPDGARSAAEDYLRRFPLGAYAARARSVVKSP